MLVLTRSAARRWALAPVILLAFASDASAQRRQPLEFTQQGLLVANFDVVTGTPAKTKADFRQGRRVGDEIRDRLGDLINKRETKIISGYDQRASYINSGFQVDTFLTLTEIKQLGTYFRSDEIVYGRYSRLPNGGARIEASLHLWRDPRQRQPYPTVTAPTLEQAAKQLAAEIHKSRVQLVHQRRCENSLRDGFGQRAIQQARAGIAAYPRGVLSRTCLIWALGATGAQASEILDESQLLLAIDPVAPHALLSAATSLDTLKRRDEAADMWLRLAATDSTNLELIERVVFAMAEHGNSRKAEPLIVRMSERYPDELRLVRQLWRVSNDNRSWVRVISSGERLLKDDPDASTDSTFFLKLATAYRANQQPFKSVEIVARGATAFPKDQKLYAFYTQFIKEEADSVLPRGLALFPNSAALLALNAKELRTRGRVEESLDASKRAIELDSTLAQGRLMIAQAEMELGRPDSALATARKAVAAGENLNDVAMFVLSKGNALFRAANGTKSRADFLLAMRFLAYADTLKPTPQSKFLLGAAALSVAQNALTEAPTIKVKEEACILAQLGSQTLPIARAGLEGGVDVSPEATRQYLEYLDTIAPYAEKQIAAFCGAATPPDTTKKTPS
jgi:hypothetical protein